MYDLHDDEMLEHLRPLYGLCHAGDYWAITAEEHLINDLDMLSVISNPALYAKFDDSILIVVSGIQVDNCLCAGSTASKQLKLKTLYKFDSKPKI